MNFEVREERERERERERRVHQTEQKCYEEKPLFEQKTQVFMDD
jgi:hypothetical protein